MIDFACPNCRKKLRIEAEHAGKQVRCPGCGTGCMLPRLSTTAVLPSNLTVDRLSAVDGDSEQAALPFSSLADALDQPTVPPAVRPETATLPPLPSASRTSSAVNGDGVPGYEILGELGRGGMGVVYKARQIGLNRQCALKMILAGGHAGEADLARFRTEGEAVARLQHPNIVQVYEVGEHEGKPFFSLEFCPGGSLDRKLAGTPIDPKRRPRLVRTLAQAMHAAHQANVIHRDLKPANILLSCSCDAESSERARRASLRRLRVDYGRPQDHRLRPGEEARRKRPDADRGHHGHAVVHGPRAGARARRTLDRRPTSTRWERSSTNASPAGRRSRPRPRSTPFCRW